VAAHPASFTGMFLKKILPTSSLNKKAYRR